MELKPITREGIDAALAKAQRYRLLNDSSAAESICLDVLAIDSENRTATVSLLLAITDQFHETGGAGVMRAREILPRLESEYDRAYYTGIVYERRAKAQLDGHAMGSSQIAADGLREAMRWYEAAEAIRPQGIDDPILRWNSCARLLARAVPADMEDVQDYAPALED